MVVSLRDEKKRRLVLRSEALLRRATSRTAILHFDL
jgi:hypothetical protein